MSKSRRVLAQDGVKSLKEQLKNEIRETHVLVFSKTTCPFCNRVSSIFWHKTLRDELYNPFELLCINLEIIAERKRIFTKNGEVLGVGGRGGGGGNVRDFGK